MSVSGNNKSSSNGGFSIRGNRSRQAEVLILDDDTMSVAEHSLSNSDDDGFMKDLDDGNEEDEPDLSDLEQAEGTNSNDDNEDMHLQEDGSSQTQSVYSDTGPKIASGSSQGEGFAGKNGNSR